MDRLALASVLLLAPSCTFVHSGRVPEIPPLQRPVFEEVVVTGLVHRDERVAGRTSAVVSTYENGRRTGYGTGVGTHYEAYDSSELRDVARHVIEDVRIARRVVSDAPIRLEGRVEEVGSDTGIARIAWNLIDVGSLAFLLGVPLTGSSAARVELRVYARDELVATYQGEGRAAWTASINRMRGARHRSELAAMRNALMGALLNLRDTPPRRGATVP